MNLRSSFASYFIATAAALSVVATAASSEAGSITFSGTNGSLSAQVKFEDVGNQLSVTLTNTSLVDALVPVDILTAVFFDSSDLTLTRVSAVLAAGSSVLYGSTDPGGVVGGEWAYKSGVLPGVTQNSGITSAGDNLTTGNAPVTGDHALIKNAVIFTFNSWNGGDVSTAINNIRFQYGTALNEGDFSVHAPEPASMLLTGTGLLALARSLRRRKA